MAIQISEDIIKALLDRGRRAPENPLMEQGAFTWGPGGTKRKAGTRDSKIIDSLLAQGTDSSPIQHPTQGMARVMAAIAGVKRERDLIGAEQQQQTERERMIMQLYGPQGDSQPPVTAPMQPQQPATPFVTQPGSVKPEQPFTPPVQEQQNPFGVAPGSVKPEQSFTQPTAAELPQNVMELTPQDINRLRKLVLTEAVHGLPDDVYNQQVGGIVDTALNRLRSGQWGKDLPSVLNAPYQFSDINGPVSWKSGRKRVDEIPDSWLNTPNGKRVAAALDAHLAARANTPPAIGGHLNYANPYYSDASNLSWINKLDGPKLGAGKAVHWHGTAGNQKPVDANYFLRVAGAQNTGATDRIVQALMASTPRAMNLSSEVQPALGVNTQQPQPGAQEMQEPPQPFQVAALGPTELPNAPSVAPQMQQGEQFAQAPQMQPFSMDDVNRAVPFLNQRPQAATAPQQQQQPPAAMQQQPSPMAQQAIPPHILKALAHPDAAVRAAATEAYKRLQPQIEIKSGQDGSLIAVDKRTLKAWPIYEAPKNHWGVIGKDRYGREQYGFINPNAKTVEQYGSQTDLGPTDEQTSKLRNEIRQLPSYKAMSEVGPRYQAMVKAAGNDNRAADLSLVYGFMKILDPTSVVRESEAEMAQKIATLPEQYRAQVLSFLQGSGRLAPEVRAAMMQEALGAAQAYRKAWDNDLRLYRGIIDRQRMNAEDVFVDFEPFPEYTPQTVAPPITDIEAEIKRRGLR